MNLSLYLDKETVFHRLHPIIKVIILGIYFVLTMFFINPIYLIGLGVIIFTHLAISKSWENISRVRHVLLMIAIGTIIIWSFFAPGETKLIGPIELESVIYGVAMTIRLQLMIIAGLIFLSTTKNEEIAIAMTKMGASYSFAFAVSTAIRLVPSIVGTGETIIQAQKSRGLNLEEGNVFSKIKKQLPLLIPIFLSTIRSNNQLAMALESKGFGALKQRTYYLDPKVESKDFAMLGLFVSLLVVSIYLKIQGLGQSVDLFFL
jgi:energy-coupling factor transport system permease protein